ncbi:hypothetical protein Patl1_36613 [Pistacia atlantica]|nr:hypothetical protein Patl1_36613 [Pistacia atlantica]
MSVTLPYPRDVVTIKQFQRDKVAVLGCDRGGVYCNRWKTIDESSAESIRRRKTGSRLTNCPVRPVQSSPVQSCSVLFSPVQSSPVQSCPVLSSPVLSPVQSSPVLSPVQSSPVLSCPESSPVLGPVQSYPVLFCPVQSNPVLSLVQSSLVPSRPVQSHPGD